MRLSSFLPLLSGDRLRALAFVLRVSGPLHRASFVLGAATSGVLGALAAGPRTLAELAAEIGAPLGDEARLAAWLSVGVRLGELSEDAGRYALRGRAGRALAAAAQDDVLALLEEGLTLHRALLVETPRRLREGRPFTLADQDGRVIARSSRVLEPLVRAAIDEVVPREGLVRLLEIGCGSGVYVRHAAERCPGLRALALELQPEVAAEARASLEAAGLGARVTVEAGDVRARTPAPEHDLATLHNNIYYFPVLERVALLRHVRGFLAPGGSLLLTTGCRGGSAAMEVLSLWGAVTEGCGPLPTPDELVGQLRDAGFVDVVPRPLLGPLESYYAFVARRPPAA